MNHSKVRICHIVNVITGKTDGVFAHIKSLADNLDKSKYEQILLYQGGGIVKQLLDIKIYEIPELRKPFSITAIKKIIQISRNNNIDVLHAHVVKPYLYAGIANFILSKKLIFNYNGLFIKESIYYSNVVKTLMLLLHNIICLMHKVDLAVVPSINSMQILLQETHLFPKILHYYNGFTFNEYNVKDNLHCLSKTKGKIIIGIVARLEIQKRLDRAFLIIKRLRDFYDNFQVIIYGDGPLENELKSLIVELDIAQLIEFKGYSNEVVKEYKNFDLLFFSSDWEGLPLSIFEAMASGVPVISTDVGGVKEIIIENQCGFIYPKDDVDAGVKCILALINDPELRIQMRTKAIEAIKNKYSIENFSKTFDQIYSDLMNKR